MWAVLPLVVNFAKAKILGTWCDSARWLIPITVKECEYLFQLQKQEPATTTCVTSA